MSKSIFENTSIPHHDSEIAVAARKEVYELIISMGQLVDAYFEKESVIPHDERFLVVSRAVSAFGVSWTRHFWEEINPETHYKKNNEN